MAIDAKEPYGVDLLLILPRQDSESSSSEETPETGWWQQIGHGILGTEAIGHGWKVSVLDASTYDSEEEFEKDLRNYEPRVVGLTPSITNGENTLQAIRLLKEHSNPIVIVGGHLVSQYRALGVLANKYSDIIDYVCVGDGRGIFAKEPDEFLKWINSIELISGNIISLSGLRYKTLDHDSWRVALEGSFASSVEIGHPIQFGDLFNLARYWRKYEKNYLSNRKNVAHKYCKPVAIQTMQGCPYRRNRACVFCNRMEKNLRLLPPAIVLQEIEAIRKYGGDSLIVVEDSGILASKRNARILADKWPSDIGIVFMYCHIKSIDEETVKILKKLNCERVFIGVESGDELALQSLGKSYTNEDVLRACRTLADHDIMVSPSFIIGAPPKDGFPGENRESISRTLSLVDDILRIGNCDLAFANVLIPYDGSAAYEILLQRIPEIYREEVASEIFSSCSKLQRLWCKHVLPITYEEAVKAKESIKDKFPDSGFVIEYKKRDDHLPSQGQACG